MFSYHMNYILSSSIDHKIALILNWSMNWIQLCLRINQKQTAIICRIPSSSTFHELQDKRQLYCRLDWRTTVKIYVHFKKWQNASKFQGFNAKKTKFIVNLVFESIVGLVVPWCKAIQPTSRPTLQLTDSGSPSRRKCPAKAWAATFSLVPNSFFVQVPNQNTSNNQHPWNTDLKGRWCPFWIEIGAKSCENQH